MAINKTIYKEQPQVQTQNRAMKALTSTQKTQARLIVSKFIQYLKVAHS
jgi:hypothetical protein